MTSYVDNYIKKKHWTQKTIQDLMLKDSLNLTLINTMFGYSYIMAIWFDPYLDEFVFRIIGAVTRFNVFSVLLLWLCSQVTLLIRKSKPEWDEALNQFEGLESEGLQKYRKIISITSLLLMIILGRNGQISPKYDNIPPTSLLVEGSMIVLVLLTFLLNIFLDHMNKLRLDPNVRSNIEEGQSIHNGNENQQFKIDFGTNPTFFLLALVPSGVIGIIITETLQGETKIQVAERNFWNMVCAGFLIPITICIISNYISHLT